MKRFLFVFIMAVMLVTPAFASNGVSMMCTEPYNLSSGASRFMSSASGSNLLAERLIASYIKKELKKILEGDFNIHVSSYSVKDLKKGIFRSFTFDGTNLILEGVHFDSFEFATLCDFNYISIADIKNPVVMENIPIAFSAVLTEDNLNATMQSSGYNKLIDDLNMLGSSLGVFNVSESRIKIRNNKFYYVLKIKLPFLRRPQNLILASDLKASRGQIDLTNTRLVNNNFLVDLKQLDHVINYINPLDFSLNILENKHAELTVQNIKIQDNKIYTSGIVIVPKDNRG